MLRLGIPVKMTVRMTVKLGRYELSIKPDNDLAKPLMIEWNNSDPDRIPSGSRVVVVR